MRKSVLVLLICAVGALAQDTFENTGVRVALKLYDDCSKTDAFSPCLKKKAVTFLDRLSRMDKLPIADGVVVMRAADAAKPGTPLTEEQLEATLPRSADSQDAALNNMLVEKVSNFIGSRTIEVALPKITADDLGLEEGRKGDIGGFGGGGGGHGGGGGGGGGGGKKKGGMMGGLMMAIAAKMAALIPIAIAGLFLLAGKALITAKIALLLSGIIAIKKLFAAKNAGGGGGGHGISIGGGHGGGYQSSGHGGGWQSSGGGWDKRSLDEAQSLAYKAHAPK